MFGSYTTLELEAERRRELVENTLREAAQRRALQESAQEGTEATEASHGHTLSEVAAGLFNRVGQRV
jgi:hypothetical protein